MKKLSSLKPWLIVGVALLDDIIVIALVFLILHVFNVKIPLPVIIIGGVLLGVFIFIVHRAIVPSLRRRKISGADGMIGMKGKVTESLKPAGMIKIRDEYWKAISIDGEIDRDEDVEVVGIKGLEVEVKKKSQ